MRGMFITVEGTEGVGKSSSIAFITQLLEARGKHVVSTREPGGTKLGERIREWILRSKVGSLSAETEILLMFAARAHHLHKIILPALEHGSWVVCDRFVDATMAYQGAGRETDREFLDKLTQFVVKDLQPDLTLLLDAPLGIGFGRIKDRPLDHFEQESRTFFERVRTEYLSIAAKDPTRVRVIDAAQTQEDVFQSITDEIEQFLGTINSA